MSEYQLYLVHFQQTIIMAVEQVCSLLGDLSSECQSLVEQYGSTVINALAQILVSWMIKLLSFPNQQICIAFCQGVGNSAFILV